MSTAIVPRPRTVEQGDGHFHLHPDGAVHCADESLQALAALARDALGLRGQRPAIELALAPDLDAEAYRLDIDRDGIRLTGGDPGGCFYALQSLLQMLPAGPSAELARGPIALPVQHIEDAPAYRWRGLHLDCSRHFFSTDFIRRLIDLLALHKLNRFHWHLCDDQGWRLQSEQWPRLTSVGSRRARSVVGHTANRERRYEEQAYGGHYSREDVREIVAYAAARHIEVVPEIDIPGHAAALLAAYPQLGCGERHYEVEAHYGIFPDVLCTAEPTFDFLGSLLREVAELFPCEYVHIGGDEVVKDHWRVCADCAAVMRREGIDSCDGLHGYFVQRVADILAQLGKRPIGWDEVMDGEVSRDTTIMCWNGDTAGRRALEAGYRCIMTPVGSTYFDFYQSTSLDEPQAIHGLTPLRKVFDFDPLPPGLAAGLRDRILGGQANVWTEYLRDEAAVEYAVLPRLCALSEALWSGPGRDWDDFCRRLPPLLRRLQGMGHRVAYSACKPVIEVRSLDGGGFEVAMATDLPGLAIHYTLDGSEPGPHTPRYRTPLAVEGDALLRACAVDSSGQRHGDERRRLARHAGRNRPLFRVLGEALAPAPELARLVDGQLGDERIFHAHEWTELDEDCSDIALELPAAIPLKALRLNFEAGCHRQLYYPSAVAVLAAAQPGAWQDLARLDETGIARAGGRLQIELGGARARYLRLRIHNLHRHYSPERRREIRRPLYLDEILLHAG